MTPSFRLYWLLPVLLVLLLGACPGLAQTTASSSGAETASKAARSAAAPPGAALSPAEIGTVISVLSDPAKRAQLAALLAGMSKAIDPPTTAAAPPQAVSVAPPPAAETPLAAAGATPVALTDPVQAAAAQAASHPAAAAALTASTAASQAAVASALKPNSLGVALLEQSADALSNLWHQARGIVASVNGLPLFWQWISGSVSAPDWRAAVISTAWRVALTVGLALLGEFLARRMLTRSIEGIARRAPPVNTEDDGGAAPIAASADASGPRPAARSRAAWRALLRAPFALLRLLLEVLPLVVFFGIINLVLSFDLIDRPLAKLAVIALVEAYIVASAVMCVTRALVSPDRPSLRPVALSDSAAAYIARWVRRLTVVAAFGIAAGQVGQLFGLYRTAYDALLELVALIDHVLLILVVLQSRAAVARRIQPRQGASGMVASLCSHLARVWHIVAIFYIMAIWVVGASGIQDGYSRLLRFFLVTAAVGLCSRVVMIAALSALDRVLTVSPALAARHPAVLARAKIYRPILRRFVSAALLVLTLIVMLQVWGLGSLEWLTDNPLGGRVTSAVVTVVITVIIALAVWEGTTAAIDIHLSKLTRAAQIARASRLRTLMPMVRTMLLMTIIAVLGLTVLSEIGVNVAPLLAGAGILGVAIGFGSQKLVQDFITGIFLLLENAMQVGDTITVAGQTGVVETLSIRTIRIRAGDGSVSIIPFSSVTTVSNANRGIGNAPVSVNVAREDAARAQALLAEIVREMRGMTEFKRLILSDFQLWGLDRVDATMVTIVGQIVCTDDGRWTVQRGFNGRVNVRFADAGIAIIDPPQAMIVHVPQGLQLPQAEPASAPPPRPVAVEPPRPSVVDAARRSSNTPPAA